MDYIRVLFVGEDAITFEEINSNLRKYFKNLDIIKAESVDETSDLLEEREFDAIVFMNQNSNSDLSSLLRDIKENEGKDIPFIIYSDEKDADLAIEALNLGADAFIVREEKNNNLDKLKDAILQEVENNNKENVNDLLSIKEEDFRSFMNSITDWVWEMDKEGVHTYSNSAVEEILGYEINDVIGYSAWKLWPEEDKITQD